MNKKQTESWDGLDAGLNYTRDLREAVARALRKARIKWMQEQQAAVAAAVAEEREACAMAAELAYGGDCKFIAAVIRARASGGKEEQE